MCPDSPGCSGRGSTGAVLYRCLLNQEMNPRLGRQCPGTDFWEQGSSQERGGLRYRIPSGLALWVLRQAATPLPRSSKPPSPPLPWAASSRALRPPGPRLAKPAQCRLSWD